MSDHHRNLCGIRKKKHHQHHAVGSAGSATTTTTTTTATTGACGGVAVGVGGNFAGMALRIPRKRSRSSMTSSASTAASAAAAGATTVGIAGVGAAGGVAVAPPPPPPRSQHGAPSSPTMANGTGPHRPAGDDDKSSSSCSRGRLFGERFKRMLLEEPKPPVSDDESTTRARIGHPETTVTGQHGSSPAGDDAVSSTCSRGRLFGENFKRMLGEELKPPVDEESTRVVVHPETTVIKRGREEERPPVAAAETSSRGRRFCENFKRMLLEEQERERQRQPPSVDGDDASTTRVANPETTVRKEGEDERQQSVMAKQTSPAERGGPSPSPTGVAGKEAKSPADIADAHGGGKHGKKKKKKGPSDHHRRRHSKPRDERWDDMYDQLVLYHRTHGHCDVPTRSAAGGGRLGSWVSRQRTEYRLMVKEGKKRCGLVTAPGRMERLRALGFRFGRKGDDEVGISSGDDGPIERSSATPVMAGADVGATNLTSTSTCASAVNDNDGGDDGVAENGDASCGAYHAASAGDDVAMEEAETSSAAAAAEWQRDHHRRQLTWLKQLRETASAASESGVTTTSARTTAAGGDSAVSAHDGGHREGSCRGQLHAMTASKGTVDDSSEGPAVLEKDDGTATAVASAKPSSSKPSHPDHTQPFRGGDDYDGDVIPEFGTSADRHRRTRPRPPTSSEGGDTAEQRGGGQDGEATSSAPLSDLPSTGKSVKKKKKKKRRMSNAERRIKRRNEREGELNQQHAADTTSSEKITPSAPPADLAVASVPASATEHPIRTTDARDARKKRKRRPSPSPPQQPPPPPPPPSLFPTPYPTKIRPDFIVNGVPFEETSIDFGLDRHHSATKKPNHADSGGGGAPTVEGKINGVTGENSAATTSAPGIFEGQMNGVDGDDSAATAGAATLADLTRRVREADRTVQALAPVRVPAPAPAAAASGKRVRKRRGTAVGTTTASQPHGRTSTASSALIGLPPTDRPYASRGDAARFLEELGRLDDELWAESATTTSAATTSEVDAGGRSVGSEDQHRRRLDLQLRFLSLVREARGGGRWQTSAAGGIGGGRGMNVFHFVRRFKGIVWDHVESHYAAFAESGVREMHGPGGGGRGAEMNGAVAPVAAKGRATPDGGIGRQTPHRRREEDNVNVLEGYCPSDRIRERVRSLCHMLEAFLPDRYGTDNVLFAASTGGAHAPACPSVSSTGNEEGASSVMCSRTDAVTEWNVAAECDRPPPDNNKEEEEEVE